MKSAALRVLLAALPLLYALPARAAASEPDADKLVGRARALGLFRDDRWLRLGHWRKRSDGSFRSEVAGGDFFLAEDGRTDPELELYATIRAALGLVPLSADQTLRKVMPAHCRFPARLAFLLNELKFDPSLIASAPCERLDEYWKTVQPEAVSLVFSSYYLNNPASMFGHTFLRIHRRDAALSADKRELLDHAVDYAAEADVGNPIAYAFKGLFGLFPGTFKLRPYFYKVREYNDFESRDIWEYQLALTPQEVAMLAAHIFELGSAVFQYYYVDENCSYQILAALEAAAPRLQLLEYVGTPVVPADTVKALYANAGLVGKVSYRPSAAAQFEARVRGMPSGERALVEALANDGEAALPADLPQAERVRVLDASADLVDVRFAKELPFETDGPAARRKQRLLTRRAEILVPSDPLEVSRPPHQPEQSHGSSRLQLGAAYSDAEGAAGTLGFRLSLHSLEDPPGGYPDLAQIQFFPSELRFAGRNQELRVERLDFIDALSLHAMNAFDHRLSWKVRFGAERFRDAGCAGCLAGDLTIGSGATFAAGPLVVWATADFSAQASDALRGFVFARGLRAGVGPAGGARLTLFERLTLLATAHWTWLPRAAGASTWGGDFSLHAALTGELSLGGGVRLYPDATEAYGALSWFY